MQSYVVVEMFLGGKTPKVRGIYKNKIDAEKMKNDYRFAYISVQNIIQAKSEEELREVYIVMEMMTLNVPNVVGVFKNKKIADEMAVSCRYNAHVIKERLN